MYDHPPMASLNAFTLRYFRRRHHQLQQKALGKIAGPLFGYDFALTNIIACHINLFTGTPLAAVSHKPHLQPIIDKAFRAEIIGNLFLTELGHGLDIDCVESTRPKLTVALFSPHHRKRFMPPSLPISGAPKWAIIISRLVVNSEVHGVHLFLAQASDETGMLPDIVSREELGSAPGPLILSAWATHSVQVYTDKNTSLNERTELGLSSRQRRANWYFKPQGILENGSAHRAFSLGIMEKPSLHEPGLPQCNPAIRVLGHALAYSVAKDAEHTGMSEAARISRQEVAGNGLANLGQHVDDLNIRSWVVSPLLTDQKMVGWLDEVKREYSLFASGLLKRTERIERMLARL
ncbi:hypothetical protein BXZ70DRAFT_1079980 [Cristinia sonorae]|uniref:Acyl-CoA oxidase n=1 Tax=Cristinia sonorae TaxID=1940300 RepID=A0A8K0UHQ6_9AGAR|nr:hypothetical protein BXZ70DRAFT_1079980 [Cristinia sonorae]